MLNSNLMAVDIEYLANFDVLRKNLDTPIDVSTLTTDQKRRGTFLYGLLASLLRGSSTTFQDMSAEQ